MAEIYLKNNKLTPTIEVNEYLASINSTPLKDGITLYDLLKRPEIKITFIAQLIDIKEYESVFEDVEIEIKYEGYIKKAYKESEKLRKAEEKQIPEDIDYDKVSNLANEARQKLKDIRPLTLSQASRISGVNPVDISILAIYLKKEYGK